MGLDFNPTFFSHPKAASGFTLSSRDEGIRRFWVEHGIACRRIAAAMGKALGSPVVTNVWIPDGYKDVPVDRKRPREILRQSLDEIFAEPLNPAHNLDAVESKLFGIGAESYTTGSHEFYLGYAVAISCCAGCRALSSDGDDQRQFRRCCSCRNCSCVSQPVRWDSDHVVILDDELKALRSWCAAMFSDLYPSDWTSSTTA